MPQGYNFVNGVRERELQTWGKVQSAMRSPRIHLRSESQGADDEADKLEREKLDHLVEKTRRSN